MLNNKNNITIVANDNPAVIPQRKLTVVTFISPPFLQHSIGLHIAFFSNFIIIIKLIRE